MRIHVRIVLLPALVLASLFPAAVPASSSPATLLASILAAGRAERSVHYTSYANYGLVAGHGVIVESQVGDAGLSVGIQRITFRENGKSGHVTVIANAATAYIRGDAFTLTNYMGFKASAASKYAETWIAIPHTSAGYSTVAADVRLVSTINELKPSAPLTLAPGTTIGGQKVEAVHGTFPGGSGKPPIAVTLYARASGSPLPVQEVTSRGPTIFSRWDEPLHVAIPVHPVPLAVVEKTP